MQVQNNSYSEHNRLIGEKVSVRLGQNKHRVQYHHVIHSLVKKPGAFENYRYREDMFPTSRFRRAYDELKARHTLRVAAREYLRILYLAASESETLVDRALMEMELHEQPVSSAAVELLMGEFDGASKPRQIRISPVHVGSYDELLEVANG